MADFGGIAAAGKSIERIINAYFRQEEPVPGKRTRALLVRTTDFADNAVATAIGSPALSIFFYRVDFNKTMRAAWGAIGHQDGRAHLPVDLHFLISAWAENAEFELRILGRAMECLEVFPILSGPALHPSTPWAGNESVQVVMEEISTEAVMRTFDSLPTDYRLSVPYIARILRIDSREAHPDVPVLTSVLALTPEADA